MSATAAAVITATTAAKTIENATATTVVTSLPSPSWARPPFFRDCFPQ